MARRNKAVMGALKAARTALGLSQMELGQLLGVSRNTIRSWEGRWATGMEPSFMRHLCRGLLACSLMPHLAIELSGPCLAEFRAKMKVHQESFGQLLGVTRSTVSRWETDTPPRWLSYVLLSIAFRD